MDSINGTETAAVAAAAAPSDAEVDNPFQADGELRRKADYIITHSRISRTEVQIADPDSPVVKSDNTERLPADQPDHAAAAATEGGGNAAVTTVDVAVEVKVSASVNNQAAPSNAEKVTIKKKRCIIV